MSRSMWQSYKKRLMYAHMYGKRLFPWNRWIARREMKRRVDLFQKDMTLIRNYQQKEPQMSRILTLTLHRQLTIDLSSSAPEADRWHTRVDQHLKDLEDTRDVGTLTDSELEDAVVEWIDDNLNEVIQDIDLQSTDIEVEITRK